MKVPGSSQLKWLPRPAPECASPGKLGLGIGSGSRRGAASERASIAGRVLAGVAVAPMTRGLQGVLICRRGTAFNSREGGGLGRPSWTCGKDAAEESDSLPGSRATVDMPHVSFKSMGVVSVAGVRFAVVALAQRRPRRPSPASRPPAKKVNCESLCAHIRAPSALQDKCSDAVPTTPLRRWYTSCLPTWLHEGRTFERKTRERSHTPPRTKKSDLAECFS